MSVSAAITVSSSNVKSENRGRRKRLAVPTYWFGSRHP